MKKIALFIYNRPILLIVVFTLIAYFPVFLPFFYIKNDLVTQMLPMRFFVSESLQSGYMPWWNPYVNFGIPQYGDMNGAFWNPIVWLISITTGYNIWTITLELMFYVFLSGWGMFLLLRNIKINKKIALIGSFSFLSCGYIIGHLQHSSWITAAAFLPFILLYFIRINSNPSVKYFLYGALSIFMFLSSVHPGLVIGAGYFFLFFIVGLLFIHANYFKNNGYTEHLKNSLLLLFLGLILSIGIVIGYSDIIPHITRGEMVVGSESLVNPTTFQSGVSLFFPLVIHKSQFFNTDISMRNINIGIAMLAGFIVFFKLAGKRMAFITFFIFLFFLLLSSGGLFKSFADKFIPGIAFVRSSGEFSLFTIFTMILAGSYGWNLYANGKRNENAELKLLTWLKYFFAITAIISIVTILISQHSLLYNLQSFQYSEFSNVIKSILDAVTINDLFLIQSFISFFFIFLFAKQSALHRPSEYLIIAGYLVLISWLSLPFTGLGSKSKEEINSILLAAPKGIHIQPLKITNKAEFIDSSNFTLAGLPNVFSKQICVPFEKEYPINMKTNAGLFEDPLRMKFIRQQAYVFLSADTTINTATSYDSNYIQVKRAGPSFIETEINNKQFNYFTYTQNNYPYWKAFINNSPVPHYTGFGSFLTIQIPKGRSVVKFEFYSTPVSISAYITFTLLALSILLLIILETGELMRKQKGISM